MKILCVAVVCLSLTSVCQPAPLDCEKLLKPVDNAPDLSGSWYIVAGSTENCLVGIVGNSMLWPSLKADITSKDTPNIFDLNIMAKMHGYCVSDSEVFLYANRTMFDVDVNNAPTTESAVLLQSSCPDCIVVQDVDDEHINTFMLLSRRKSVTDAELKEFESQMKCLGWSTMQLLNTDHDYEHCLSTQDMDIVSVMSNLYQRLKTQQSEVLRCLLETADANPLTTFEWIKELFT